MKVDLNPRIVTLGTAGGPRWWQKPGIEDRSGIATAVVVGDSHYLVDAGHGVGRQMSRASLAFPNLRGVFLTHLHSDHTIDLASILLFGFMHVVPGQKPIRILGPGNRLVLPPVSPHASVIPNPVFPDNPTRGTSEMVQCLLEAYSTDINDRVLDSLRPSPKKHFVAQDIAIPDDAKFHPNDNPIPSIEPFEIYRDELVTVTATLVSHPPIAPAFAFRFDTEAGSVTISGDTAPSQNLVRLAHNTDLLLHEAIDFDWVEQAYAHEDPATAEASVAHHRKSHSSALQAGEIATQAGARTLALHHLVPGTADPAVWERAQETFAGNVLVPNDLDVISFCASSHQTEPVLEPAGFLAN